MVYHILQSDKMTFSLDIINEMMNQDKDQIKDKFQIIDYWSNIWTWAAHFNHNDIIIWLCDNYKQESDLENLYSALKESIVRNNVQGSDYIFKTIGVDFNINGFLDFNTIGSIVLNHNIEITEWIINNSFLKSDDITHMLSFIENIKGNKMMYKDDTKLKLQVMSRMLKKYNKKL